jgi:hypothetical protein
MKRTLLLLGACALLFGCRPGGSGIPNPLSGTWSEIESSLAGGELPFDLADVDPDAAFELINSGFSGGVRHIELQGLSELLPSALTGALADAAAGVGAEAAALQDWLGLDLGAVIGWLTTTLGPIVDALLEFLGLGSLDEVLPDLIDLQALVDGFGGDLAALLAELPGLGGTLPDSASCTLAVSQLTCGALACGDLSCDPVQQVVDLGPGVDALLTLSVEVSGSFQGPHNAQLYVTTDLQCDGADCAAVLGLLPIEIPFTYSLVASDL